MWKNYERAAAFFAIFLTRRTALGFATKSVFLTTSTSSRESKMPKLSPCRLSIDDSWSDVAELVNRATSDVSNIQVDDLMTEVGSIEWTKVLQAGPGWNDIKSVVANTIALLPPNAPLYGVPIAFLLVTFAFLKLSFPDDDFREGFEPYKRGNYDPLQARVYYSKQPILVLQRSLQLLRISNKFLLGILFDKYILRNEEANRSQRAQELLELIQQAGPTAIKVGQALSVRPDLVPPEYADALSTLQDRVPPFPNARAKQILQRELGDSYSLLKDVTTECVASASIGQVYKGRIISNDGFEKNVAIKVQRPNVLAEIALDLYLVREFAPIYQKMTRSATNFQSLANEWGRGFIAELDYNTEAENTIRFNEEMKKRNLNAVTAPIVLEDFSTNKILVTEWVDGTRLDQSNSDDVPRLCSVALNAYLVMLLEMSLLHSDPHPGNLLRTSDGRLCILDFGMTLEIDPNLQYSLLEFVAHLTGEDYDRVPEDLVKLGFLKADRLDTVRASGFLKPLTYMLQQAGQGGGADKVRERIFTEFREKYPGMEDEELRVQMRADMKKQIEEQRKKESAVSGITMEVEELQKKNRDAFQIPEWFVYTSRAFLTLEGVSLQVDEDYSIIKSCFPYVAKRLLGDDSPRAQQALRDLLYGAGEFIEPERLADLADGFASYTSTSKVVNGARPEAVEGGVLADRGIVVDDSTGSSRKAATNNADAEAAITLAKDSADILLARDGNMVQSLLVEETALAASAQVKDALRDTLVDGPARFRESLPLGLGSVLPALPIEEGVKPFLEKTQPEEKAQKLVGKLSSFLPQPPALPSIPNPVDGGAVGLPDQEGNTSNTPNLDALREIDAEQAAMVAKELRLNLPKYAPLVGQLGAKFGSTLLQKASANIEATLTQDKPKDDLTNAAARTLSNLATSGAEAMARQATATQEQIGEEDKSRRR